MTTLENILGLHAYFQEFAPLHSTGWWYRGHSRESWRLIPKAGREEYFLNRANPEHNPGDIGRFIDWKNNAIGFGDLPSDDLECLAFAQHHGLATRLLDWTYNPLVATYFACFEEREFSNDGYVYCYRAQERRGNLEDLLKDKISGIFAYEPRALSRRILNQRAVFTVHCPPTQEISRDAPCLRIPKGHKQNVLRHLDEYGVNRASMFPDLDGLSAYTNFKTQVYMDMQRAGRKT